MPIPSLYSASRGLWNISHAAGYGAGLGLFAAALKIFGPLHRAAPTVAASVVEIVAAAAAFAVLCAAAAALRNFLAQRLVWPGMK
jgi:hypothetical protein